MKQYYIACVGEEGAPYFYHSDKRFYWNVYDTSKLHIKRWKTLKAAKNTFNSIKVESKFNNLSLLCDEIGESGEVTTTCIEKKSC